MSKVHRNLSLSLLRAAAITRNAESLFPNYLIFSYCLKNEELLQNDWKVIIIDGVWKL